MAAPLATTAERLPSLVKEAAAVLSRATSAAEVLAAHDLAAATYDAAKRQARLQKAKRAHDELVAATYRVQADSLEIESLAKRRLADEYDAAQHRGEVGKKGQRTDLVPAANKVPTAEEAGLSRKQVFEARQIRDAIEQDPGIVRRALDQMLAAGDEPTRAGLKRAANLRAAVGTDTATAAERGNNLYETPPEAMRTLLNFMRFSPKVLEPACGRGAISRMLEDAGYDVELADLVDYGTATKDGELQRVEDFLQSAPTADDPDRPDIVTNPPYGAALNAFVAHALKRHRPRRMALLLNLNFLCGFDDADRNFAMDEAPPARIYVFKRRLPMMHRDGWDGPEASSRMNTAWFIWELRSQPDGSEGYDGPTEIMRVDWKVFENAAPCGPAEQLPAESVTDGWPTKRGPKVPSGGSRSLTSEPNANVSVDATAGETAPNPLAAARAFRAKAVPA
ncbi:SAM-dependent methyltransferase [Mesorhizobium sp. WSM4962]|uniref:SAM-dependent methyltransferase n=1 Tax=Mesorhizobium sp. WSM4962 TaxID=3038548 RepID=UPI002417285F|nr:SAM-dependent methyltransferase [Mesorhizobium sp. WSM4962]MDG4903182.1 SAM-dependent methyltransferase [Mesorhizobium sp. WSM4962]